MNHSWPAIRRSAFRKLENFQTSFGEPHPVAKFQFRAPRQQPAPPSVAQSKPLLHKGLWIPAVPKAETFDLELVGQ